MDMTSAPAYPAAVTREEWLAARKRLLAREREVTHLRDAVNAERRRLPMVKVDKDYLFEGPEGRVGLLDMFDGTITSVCDALGRRVDSVCPHIW